MMRKIKLITTLIAFSVLLVTYTKAQTFEKVWETNKVLKTPESVLYDTGTSRLYVSNINGKPLEKDGNGFISVLEKDGTISSAQWVSGMNAPKGMTMVGRMLYVTDIDRFHIIDTEKATIIKTIPVADAEFLNDMAADDAGNIYFSDMSRNKVHLYNGDMVKVWLEGDQVIQPNGMAFHKGALYVGTKDQLLRVDIATKKIKTVVKGTGPIDGLIPVGGGKFVISNWSGRIMLVSANEKIVLSNTTEQKIQAADLGYIPDEKLVLIPTFFDNRVVAHKLQ